MFNPYLNRPTQMLEPVTGKQDLLGGIMKRFRELDSDDLLLMLIVYLVMKDGKRDDVWPLLAALLYCIL